MANKKLNAVITIGGAIASSLTSAMGTAKSKLTEIGSAVRKLEREQRMLSESINTFGRMGKNVDTLRARYASVTAEIEKQRRAQERLNSARNGMDAGKSRMAGAGLAIGAVAAAASTAFIPVVQAASFEKAMLGVAKQVEGARDESGKLTTVYHNMAQQVQKLGREMPIATNEIAEMVAAGARMGVAKDELIQFTRTAGMMASAFELPAGQLADDMGKIAALFKIPIPAIGELADTINYLDDNAISKGKDIIEFLTRTGGVASAVKVTGKEMAALGSTLLTLGERTETASTATNAMFQKFAAAEKGTKKFQSAMKELGLKSSVIQKGMQKDAQGTILTILEAINKLPKDKQLGVGVELVGLEHSDTLAKLSNNVAEYRKQIALAGSEKAKGSMSREFSATLATTNAQWEITKNLTTEVSVNIGSVLLPAVNSVMGAFGRGAAAVADFVRENQTLVGNIATVVGTIGGLVMGAKMVSFGIGAVMFAFNALSLAMAINPIGLLVIALTTAAVLIYKNWEPIKAFFADLWDGIAKAALVYWDALKTVLSWTPIGLIVTHWEPIRAFFSNLWADITATARQAFDWILGKIDAIGAGWQKTKAFFGFSGDAPAAGASAAPAGAALPAPPPMAGGRGGQASVQTTNNNNIQITQQPGENGDQLAQRVIRKMEERKGIQNRSAMYDPVTP